MKRIILILFPLVLLIGLKAQETDFLTGELLNSADSLEGNFQSDSVAENTLFCWKYHAGGLIKEEVLYDTVFGFIHDYKESEKVGISANILPTSYSPFISNSLFARGSADDFPFATSIIPYFTLNNDVVYIRSSKPLSMISYANSGDSEERFDVSHSQTVKKDLCFGFNFRVGGITEPRFKRAEEGYRAFTAFADYAGLRYRTIFNLNYGRLKRSENGGFVEGAIDAAESYEYRSADVYLESAESFLKYSSFKLSHELNLGRSQIIIDSANYVVKPYLLSLGLDAGYISYKRKYHDDMPNTSYYEFQLNDTTAFVDSAFYYRSDNNVFFSFAPSFGKSSQLLLKVSAGLVLEEYLTSDVKLETEDQLHSSNYVNTSALLSLTDEINIAADFRKYLLGRRKAQTDFSFYAVKSDADSIKGIDAKASFRFMVKPPSLAHEFYSSAVTYWNASFDNEVHMKAELLASLKEINLSVGLRTEMLSNHIYFDETVRPQQASDAIVLAAASVEKDSRWKIFGMTNRLIVQHSTLNDIVSLPRFVSGNSLYLHGPLFDHNLYMKVGGELKYFTSYSAPVYDPATSIFCVQNEKTIGGKAYVNFFVDMRFKRMGFFLKLEKFTGDVSQIAMESAVGYKQYPMHLVYGLKWYFYN